MSYSERLGNFNETINRANETAGQAAEYAQGLKAKLNDPSADLFSKVNSLVNTGAGTTSTLAGLYTSYKHARLQNWSTQKDLLDVKQQVLNQVKSKIPGSNPPSSTEAAPQQTPELDKSAFTNQANRTKQLSNADDIKSQVQNDPIAGKNPNDPGLSASDKQDIFDARNNIIDKNVNQLPSPPGQGQPGGGQAPQAAQAPQGAANDPGQSQAPSQAQNLTTDADNAANDVKNTIGSVTTPAQNTGALLDQGTNDLAAALRGGQGSVLTGLKTVNALGQDASNLLPGNIPGLLRGAANLANGAGQQAIQAAGQTVSNITDDAQSAASTVAKVAATTGESLGDDALSGAATGLLASAPELGPAGLITGAIGGLIQLGSTIAGVFESKPKPPPPPAPVPVIQASVGANLSQIQK
tara:strand:- start:1360 stop:2592 length:1233 start_codon:yes stop_codon:yes gene_type:complete